MNAEILPIAYAILNKICEGSRSREGEIMQGLEGEKEHAESVLSWVKKLASNPSIPLMIAALFHDIDRVVTPGAGGGFKGDRKSIEYYEHKKLHAERSANYICPILEEYDVSPDIVKRVKFLISHHDNTGPEIEALNDGELNILVAADTLSFFTSIAPKLYEAEGEGRLRDKIKFMVEKMPRSLRNLLKEQQLENPVLNEIKNEALEEREVK